MDLAIFVYLHKHIDELDGLDRLERLGKEKFDVMVEGLVDDIKVKTPEQI